ncbi:protein translocase SEC61 complex subunit gamma [Candidatus Pacearchaeota archaeon]|nr:protein translocase SEC61 complex subunit gamma [Candidatus Pacearchaeota archaeon]
MEETQSVKQKLTSFYHQSVRVWHILRKPTRKEFLMVTKISAIGILIVGIGGFIISIFMGYFF